MIETDIRWRLTARDVPRVQALCSTAAGYDAEAGFAVIDPARVGTVNDAVDLTLQVVIRYKSDFAQDPGLPLDVAAYGLLEPDEAAPRLGWLRYVVLPELRSLGITTMAAEAIGLSGAASGRGVDLPFDEVRWWAYGSHPAADRFARRFGLRVVDETWRVVGAVRGQFSLRLDQDPAPGVEVAEVSAGEARSAIGRGGAVATPGGVAGDLAATSDAIWLIGRDSTGAALGFAVLLPKWRLRDGRKVASVLEVGQTRGDRGVHQALMAAAAARLRDAGAEFVDLHLDPRSGVAVSASRRLGFEVEHVNTCYAWSRESD